jgi:penicillin-insensitive murein DD-endopeptidase
MLPRSLGVPIINRVVVSFVAALMVNTAIAAESTCYGTTSSGRLENGVQLPDAGSNFETYSRIGSFAGRTYVHSKVADIVLDAYQALEASMPMTVFVYGETGLASGGRFSPHKTHQNGLSVDFMVPVLKDGKSVPLPTSPLNKFGYAIEFDQNGSFEDYSIDYEAMAEHLYALHRAATTRGIKIWRVIFDVPLQKLLFQSKRGDYLQQNLVFSKKPAWVRHDEHYHVDFEVSCRPLKG